MEHIKAFVLLGLMSVSASYKMARLHNAHSTVTSSTLAWTLVNPTDALPANAVPIGSGGPSWCRTRERTVWVSGAVVEGKCRVPFLGNVIESESFEVLVSLNGSSRLVNEPWDSLVAWPDNAVATPDMLLALSQDPEGGAVLPGFVDPSERRAHFLKGDEAIKLDGGHLVTEKEPVAYRLGDVRLSEKTDRQFHDDVLQEFTLENTDDAPNEASHTITFMSAHSSYFGKMKGTFVGLPTTVMGPDTFPVEIVWGIHNELNTNRSHTVTYNLPGKSYVKVRLIAIIRVLEGAYSGYLTSVYDDGVELARNVAGLHTERKLSELRAEFGQTFSMETDEPLEASPPQTLVLLHSTTTTLAPPTDGENALSESTSGGLLLPRPEERGVNGAQRISCWWGLTALVLILALP